jgi:hypothetical protein
VNTQNILNRSLTLVNVGIHSTCLENSHLNKDMCVFMMSSPKVRVSWSFCLCISAQRKVLDDFITYAVPPHRSSAYLFQWFSYSMIEDFMHYYKRNKISENLLAYINYAK